MFKSFLRPLSIASIRRFILIAILFILFWNVTYWIGEAWKPISGVVWGVGTALLAIFCRYKAGKTVQINKTFVLWMSIPGLLTVVPFVVRLVTVFKSQGQSSLWQILWQVTPLILSLIIPVGLLVIAYTALKHHLPPEPIDKPSDSTPPAT